MLEPEHKFRAIALPLLKAGRPLPSDIGTQAGVTTPYLLALYTDRVYQELHLPQPVIHAVPPPSPLTTRGRDKEDDKSALSEEKDGELQRQTRKNLGDRTRRTDE